MPEIVTSSLAVNPNQYGVLTVRGRNGQYNTESVDVSSWAEAEGLTNEDLLNFDEYSERFFYDTAVQQGLDELGGEGERETELARFYAMANTLYFAGLNNQIEWDEDAMDEWSERGFFIPRYLETIRLDSERNYTRFEF